MTLKRLFWEFVLLRLLFVSCLSLTHLLINFLSRSVYRTRSPVSVIVLAWLLPNQQCIWPCMGNDSAVKTRGEGESGLPGLKNVRVWIVSPKAKILKPDNQRVHSEFDANLVYFYFAVYWHTKIRFLQRLVLTGWVRHSGIVKGEAECYRHISNCLIWIFFGNMSPYYNLMVQIKFDLYSFHKQHSHFYWFSS